MTSTTKQLILSACIVATLALAIYSKDSAAEELLQIQLEIPELDASPYFRPYIAVWLETPKRQAVTTLALWYDLGEGTDGEGTKWLKDLRQWWRKTGRTGYEKLDAVTGATRRPGSYQILWDGTDDAGNSLPPGDYLLNFEASRESGGRDYHRQPIRIGPEGNFRLRGDVELGDIKISIRAL